MGLPEGPSGAGPSKVLLDSISACSYSIPTQTSLFVPTKPAEVEGTSGRLSEVASKRVTSQHLES